MKTYFIGLDLGQAGDYTALTIIKMIPPGVDDFGQPRERPYEFHLTDIYRYPLNVPYPDIVDGIRDLTKTEPMENNCIVFPDKTGVGRAVTDQMVRERVPMIPITITGGTRVSFEGGYHVPKRDLITSLRYVLQGGYLKIASGLKKIQTDKGKRAPGELLRTELENFRLKINTQTGHDKYEAWREGTHDDLVLSAAMPAWYLVSSYLNKKVNRAARLLAM